MSRQFWIVLSPGPKSTFEDVVVKVTPETFALMIKGGLDPANIVLVTQSDFAAENLGKKLLRDLEEFLTSTEESA